MTWKDQEQILPINGSGRDSAFMLAASWEDRCVSVSERLAPDYSADLVLITVYDGQNARREENIRKLKRALKHVGTICEVPALHADSLPNVRETVARLRDLGDLRLTIDVSCYTREHLLQLLHGLDLAGMLGNARFLYAQPSDYHTFDNEPVATGVRRITAIQGLAGSNRPSKDTVLVMFLSYEGRRALALWESQEPNQTFIVIPDPPYLPEWDGRTEAQNRYLLSLLDPSRVLKVSPYSPSDTESLLGVLWNGSEAPQSKYNYRIAPLGTKGQILGIYRFWRRHPGAMTLVYASPLGYKHDRPQFPVAKVVQLDDSSTWAGTR